MKNLLILILSLSLVFSCSRDADDAVQSEASVVPTFQTKQGKPSKANFFQGGTFTSNILMEAGNYGLIFNNLSEYQQTGLFYSRRETSVDPDTNYSLLEEINSRDYKMQVARGGKGSFLWMDGNPANANFLIDINEDGGYSGLHVNNNFIVLTQDKGIYNLRNLKTFNSNEEARAYFESVNWRKLNTIYKTPDGDLKVTY